MEFKKQRKQIQKRLATVLDIPNDIVMDLPKITMIGNIQLYIENHRGIIEYSLKNIRISVSFGEIEVAGEGLIVRSITREEIHLDGEIKEIWCSR